MLRRTFLKAVSALAAMPLAQQAAADGVLDVANAREVTRVTLTYEAESIDLAERFSQCNTFNDRPLAGIEAGRLLCVRSEFEIRYRGTHQYCHATAVYEPRPEDCLSRRQKPVLRSMRLIDQKVEYA